MRTVSASEAKQGLAKAIEAAAREPILIQRQKRDVAVILFLDEIADLPLHMQVKLLRAIQEKHIRAVGSQQEIPIDTRIISATHKDLAQLVESGDFSQDLFYRINVIELPLPPLRERIEDIPLLAQHLLTRLSRQVGNKKLKIHTRRFQKTQGV